MVFELLAEGGAVTGSLGHELALHAFFILKDEFVASGLVEVDAAFVGFEVGFVEHFVGEEIEGERLAKDGAEGFHEIEGEGPAAVFGGVEESESGIQTVGVDVGMHLVIDEGGGEGDYGVYGGERWAGGTALEGEVFR